MSKDRKTKIEYTHTQAEKLIGTHEAAMAWHRLCKELESMSAPDIARSKPRTIAVRLADSGMTLYDCMENHKRKRGAK